MRGEPHIVLVDGYWVDVVPSDPIFSFSDHLDRPGVIGAVGTLLGNADINISFMQVGRSKPRGRAMMVLGLDEPIPDKPKRRSWVYLICILRVWSNYSTDSIFGNKHDRGCQHICAGSCSLLKCNRLF